LENLRAGNFIYPCTCSRKDILAATRAPHANDDDEPIYPGTCRGKIISGTGVSPVSFANGNGTHGRDARATKFVWRFRVCDGEIISFYDENLGAQKFVAGEDFGDFVIWRGDDIPAYQLACVADDAAMKISEVVRGADLLISTARQILLYRALKLPLPNFFHCQLMLDENGRRLAKRHDVLSLQQLRERGETPESLRQKFFVPI
jgi:glutamyl-tRNA synthetase